MISRSQQTKRRDAALIALDESTQTLNAAKDTCGVPPAKNALASAFILLTTIREKMDKKDDYVNLGLSCADVCGALDRGLNGKRSDKLSEAVKKAIEKLTTTVAEIQGRVDEKNDRNVVSKILHAWNDKDTIAAWKEDLNRLLQIFNTELAIDTNVTATETDRKVTEMHELAIKESVANKQSSNQASVPIGELPPPVPKAFFGRDTLIEEVVALAEKFQPIALIGAGGIGKTSIALAVLHHDRIKHKFGDNRRFLRCDKFTPSLSNFLAQLSEVIGAGVQNPDNFDSLRPFLSSKRMILFLDNVESILDPQGTDAREIYIVVEELGRFKNICLGITSRILTVPPHCKRPAIPTLSIESACEIFYSIYNHGEQSDIISDLVTRLDFHPLSITLIATAASHNAWDYNQLFEEWNVQRAQVLRTDYNQSLAATIELSLISPTFRKLGPSARELLGVIAFFPQGVDRSNLRWLFPTIPDIKSTFDKFCTLSLTYRNGDFFTMLAPIRDYLAPSSPTSSPLLCETKGRYVTRLSVEVYPSEPGFKETEWIVSEDVNVEHLLDTFTSLDASAGDVWDACSDFVDHLRWHKPRKTVLGLKIEGLPDDHPSKPGSLVKLSELYNVVGNNSEQKRLLAQALKLDKKRGDRPRIALTLKRLSDANRRLRLYKEGVQQARGALEIYVELGDRRGQTGSLNNLALILFEDDQLDDAEAAAFRAINLAPENGQEILLCQSHRSLGLIYQRKGQKEGAIHHFETAIGIASHFKWHDQIFWNHLNLAVLSLLENEFDKANAQIEEARLHTANNAYNLARAMRTQARIWFGQGKLEGAKLEVSRALEVFEKLGAVGDGEECRILLRRWSKLRS